MSSGKQWEGPAIGRHAKIAGGLILALWALTDWTPHALGQGQPLAPASGPGWSTSIKTPPKSVASRIIELGGDRQQTRVTIELSRATTFQVFRLESPDRVVIDLADVEFQVPRGTGLTGRGLVKSFRYGAFAPGKARVVIDTDGPVKIEATRMLDPAGASSHRLEIDLTRAAVVDLAASEVAAAAANIPPVIPIPEPEPSASADPKTVRAKPIIMIDPGHGGIDPGAQGSLGSEKDIVLAVALELRRTLEARGLYSVRMTRSSDVFVPLDQRVQLSQAAGSHLFISIHADSLASASLAQNIRGASLYTLSTRATNDAARRYAEKENAADLIAGLLPSRHAPQVEVRDILFDLMRRETSNLSIDIRRTLTRHLRSGVKLTRDPQRAADFVVLRQPSTPSVLIELGYITHAEDEKLMRSGEWQRKIAKSIAAAVNDYFRRNAVAAGANIPPAPQVAAPRSSK